MKHKLLKALKWPLQGRRKYFTYSGVGLIMLAMMSVGLYLIDFGSGVVSRPQADSALQDPEKIETAISPLTGIEVPKKDTEIPVTAVVIENSPQARPQSGLSKAGVVFEAIAEGGITRFLAFYQESSPGKIGPVRSLRPYFIDWLMGFDATIAHVGGSAEALKQVQQLGLKDLDQFFGSQFFYRSSDRSAPHNVYTSRASLRNFEESRGYDQSNFTPLPRKESAPSNNPSVTDIDFNVSYQLYTAGYDYDKTTNTYIRSMAGQPHRDREGGARINPNVIIALVMDRSIAATGHSIYETIGSGSALVFQDGEVTSGTWTKLSRTSQISLKDSNGSVIKINPGQTWFHIIEATNEVTYKGSN